MKDPVITMNGHTYERAAIEKWFEDHTTDPKTGERVDKKVIPNWALKGAIDEFNILQQQRQEMEYSISDEINECLLESECYILKSIPDHVAVAMDLMGIQDEASLTEHTILQEKHDIADVKELLEYYVAVQLYLNGTVVFCEGILKRRRENEDNGIAEKVSSSIYFIFRQTLDAPGVRISLNIIRASLSTNSDSTKRERMEKVVKMFKKDAELLSSVAEMMAREMTKLHKDDLVGVDKGNAKLSSTTVSERVRAALWLCRSPAGKSDSKEMAKKHVEMIITAIMDGTMVDLPHDGDLTTIFNAAKRPKL
mmetsp:Transcript_8872/g.12273  ORF Transcript_8872/g.12273 Transcript_8872/m.12273 type:complete len:309 (+) Transcript_8872:955-1881(+)